jgi:hypothetical protein
MAMKKSGTGSGGGIGSKNVVHKPVITGKPPRAFALVGLRRSALQSVITLLIMAAAI